MVVYINHSESWVVYGVVSPHEMPIAIMMVRSPHHRTASSQGWGRQRSLWVPLSRPSQGPGPPESASPPGTTSIGCWRSQSPTVISLHSHTWIAYKYIYIYIYYIIYIYMCVYVYIYLSHSLVIYIYVCMYVFANPHPQSLSARPPNWCAHHPCTPAHHGCFHPLAVHSPRTSRPGACPYS